MAPSKREARYRELYELLKDKVNSVCYRMMGNTADALDASQATFAIVFRRLDAFRFEAPFSRWATRIAINTCIDLHRRRRPHATIERVDEETGELSVIPVEDDGRSPDLVAELHEDADGVRRGIARLSPKLRQVIVLRYIEGLSYPELAEDLGLAIGTVKSRLSRAHVALMKELEWMRPEKCA